MTIEQVRKAIRQVEKYGYLLVGSETQPQRVTEAQTILRMTIGLRRKLDNWSENVK